MTVTKAVEAVGASVKSVAPAKAQIELKEGQSKEVAINAIEKAGYVVHETF